MRSPPTLFAVLCLFGASCGGSTEPKQHHEPVPSKTVEDELTKLGVDLNAGPRVDERGNALPDGYAPLGSSYAPSKIDELFIAGIPLLDPTTGSPLSSSVAWAQDELDSPEILHAETTDPVWAVGNQGSRTFGQSTRAGTALDLDGDGRDEVAVVYVDTTDPAHDAELMAVIYNNAVASTPFAQTTSFLSLEPGIVDLEAQGVDFDGDGDDDLVLGLVTDTVAKLLFVKNDAGALSVVTSATQTFAFTLPSPEVSWALAKGQLDYDPGEEVGATLNEYVSSPEGGISHYFVFDDAEASFAQLQTGTLEVTGATVQTAVVADITLGDIDGDGLDEIVLGGLGAYVNTCDAVPLLGLAIDDATHGLATIGSMTRLDYLSGCPSFSPWLLRWAPVNALDLDADGIKEIEIGTVIFDNWVNAFPFTELHRIPLDAFFQSNDFGWLDTNTSDVEVGDLSGDGREDVIVYAQNRDSITVWGDDAALGWGQRGSIPVSFENAQTPRNPILVPANLDDDTMVLRYGRGTYQLVFTQPIVLAALAAPPCNDAIGQNLDACYTTFGTSVSSTVTEEQVLTVTASASVGFKVIGGALTQSEASVKAKVSVAASQVASQSYTLTRSVVFTTGSMEDTVIFTTIPYDQYTYTITSAPDPDLVGKALVVSLPRSPVTLMAERGFYNNSITADSLHIEDGVFHHTPGELDTYPTLADKNQLTSLYGGLTTPAQSVGQGAGSVEIGLDVGQEYSLGYSLELGFELEVEATAATVLGGFSVGASVQDSLTVTSGTETSYTGSIGAIGTDDFAANLYSYGLFTYVQPDAATGQQFEVVNYWVE